MAKEARLLTTQKSELLPIAQNAGFDPAEFEWVFDDSFEEKRLVKIGGGRPRAVTDVLMVSALLHKPSRFYCKFGHKTMVISPGEDQLIQTIYPKDRQLGFRQWLTYLRREVRSPDLWDTLRNDAVNRLGQTERANLALESANKRTAASELREADADLSRRPADLTGAVQHSLAALECVAREHCGDQATFGKLLERYPDLFPKPLDKGMEKVWGFASEMGRHLREGRTPKEEEAELLVGLATACCTYLARKIESGDADPT